MQTQNAGLKSRILKHLLLAACFLTFYCQYFEDISPPENIPEGTPLNIPEADKKFFGQNALRLYEAGDPKKKIRVAKIYVFNRPISLKDKEFDNCEGFFDCTDKFIPRVINFFHWTTEKSVIANEVLFREGSVTNLERVAESERLVRRLISIKEARIYLLPAENDPDTYDVYIYAEDKLTSTVNSDVEFNGGAYRVFLSAGDLNFFGRLIELSAIYNRVNFVNTYGIDAGQARFLGTTLELRTFFRESFVGAQTGFEVGGEHNYTEQTILLQRGTRLGRFRSFRSLRDRYAFFTSLSHGQGVRYRFTGADVEIVQDPVNGRFYQMILGRELLTWDAEIWRAFGRLDRLELGLGFGQDKDKTYFSSASQQFSINPAELSGVSEAAKDEFLPVQEDGRFIKLGVNLRSIDFVTRKNFQLFTFNEDLFRGVSLINVFRFANPAFGLPDNYTQIDTTFSYIYDQNAIRNNFTIRRRGRKKHTDGGGWINDFFTADNRFFYFTKHGTYALRSNFGIGYNLDRDNKFEFGGDYVRGFVDRSVVGDLSYLLSLEFRTLPVRFWYFALGGILFFDYGQVTQGIPQRADQLKPEPVLGLGFRSSAVEFDNNIFRFDLGFPLRAGSFEIANQVSFGLRHTF